MTANLVNAAPFSLSSHADSRSDGLVCDLSLGEPRRQNFPAEICKSLLDLAAINHYYPAYGLPALRQNIQNRFYPQLNPADYMVFMTHGAIHGIDLLLRSALKPGEEILLPDPGFPPYQRLAELIGVKSRTYNLTHSEHGFAFDIESIAQSLTPDTRVLVINSPHNPTGAMLRPEQIRQLGILLKDFPDLMLISDEVYSEIVYSEPHQTLAGITPRTYVVNSFSKTFSLQGFRIGWIYAPRGYAAELMSYLQNSVGCVSSLGQEIVLELLGSSDWLPCSYHKARSIACEILTTAGLSFVAPEGAFFLLIKVPDDEIATRQLADDGIKVVPGRAFGTRTRGWIRVCFAQKDDVVRRDFRRLAHSLKQMKWDRI